MTRREERACRHAAAHLHLRGEALPESVGNAWKARFGVDILDGVGSTELLHIFLSNAPGDIKYGASGRRCPATRCGW
jgi:4-hydroxybenzoate-CoA ligase